MTHEHEPFAYVEITRDIGIHKAGELATIVEVYDDGTYCLEFSYGDGFDRLAWGVTDADIAAQDMA